MMNFTIEEINLMCIYNPGTRTGLIEALENMTGYLTKEETELRGLAESVIARLRSMTDFDFHMLQDSLIPDFS